LVFSKLQFWGSYTLIVAPVGVKFDKEEGTVAAMGVRFGTEEGSFVPNFTPIGATCRPCGQKNLKIGL